MRKGGYSKKFDILFDKIRLAVALLVIKCIFQYFKNKTHNENHVTFYKSTLMFFLNVLYGNLNKAL